MVNPVTFDITPCDKKGKKARVKVYQDQKLIEVDTLTIESRKSRTSFVNSVAQKTGLDKAQLDKLFIEQIENMKSLSEENQAKEIDPLDNCSPESKNRAMEMLKSPDLFEIIREDIEKIGIAGEQDLCRQLYIIMSSRILDKPLSGIVFGASSSGKSYLIETVSKMMPDEAVLQAHDITDEALYYLEPGTLENRIVIAGERLEDKRGKRGKAEDNTKALREMLASGKLSKLVTTKDSDGQPCATLIEQEGPIAYLESTTSTSIHDEDATRLLPLVTDESAKQTEIIIEAMRKKAIGENKNENVIKIILEKHKTAQRLLKKYRVNIPYADFLKLPCEIVATRRAYDQLLSMIKSVAILRQYQKEKINDSVIEADIKDYEIIYHLILKIFSRTYCPINEKSRDLLKIIIEKNVSENDFKIQQLVEWTGISDASVRRRLRELIFKGIISEDKNQKPYSYKIENADLAEFADINLIAPEEIEERLAIMEF